MGAELRLCELLHDDHGGESEPVATGAASFLLQGATPLPVIGAKAMPRTEVTKKLWAHIKKNGLQDAKKRTMINADEKLAAVFGGKKQVSMFEMTKLVGQHMK